MCTHVSLHLAFLSLIPEHNMSPRSGCSVVLSHHCSHCSFFYFAAEKIKPFQTIHVCVHMCVVFTPSCICCWIFYAHTCVYCDIGVTTYATLILKYPESFQPSATRQSMTPSPLYTRWVHLGSHYIVYWVEDRHGHTAVLKSTNRHRS